MKREEAIKTAIESIEREGLDTEKYDFVAKRVSEGWQIHFYRKAKYRPRPGDFITVCIDGKSKLVSRILRGK